LLGADPPAVVEDREGELKGHHTTAFRELFLLPSGACLIETAGVRELGLSLDPEVAMTAYAEIEEAARRCFLGDGRHETGPGRPVQKEVDLGHLNATGIASYLSLRREAEDLERRRDLSRRSENLASERRIDKMTREEMRRKKDR
jgi:ribosome biogenesis GTPase